ncbi:MAG TPA: adenylate/guanylate cyclase domain-containing protein [Chitinophagaceae bacterium]|nr:adenylate/guanylate cyclase domain-containing protein [Chitinophagaceae bacterium]
MARINLKSIVGRKNEATTLIRSLIEEFKSEFSIEDAEGNLLLGNKDLTYIHQEPISIDDELLGWVKGDQRAAIIAQLLTHLVQKESDKKKMGSEVLNLYQEVNLIFDFSEKLAQTMGAAPISQITLDEASRVISSDSGVVLMWDENARQLNPTAITGEIFFNPEKIHLEQEFLARIVLNGQSEIINDVSSLAGSGIVLPWVKSIMFSALKVKHRVMGALILASKESERYAAGDLKLLTTLALQSSAAIESALLYEKNIQEAHEREEAMRKVYDATARFVPHEFINALGRSVITDVKLGDQVEKIVTVLFSDIREYTTISEKMTPAENFKFVCSFNERMGPIIRRHNGFINQYLGDAIMAIFPGNSADALSAAIAMQKEVEVFNKERKQQQKAPIRIGVGMHTGSLIMGITGDHDRMDATTISDTVNTAARLEGLTKHYKGGIIISDACLQQIADPSRFYLRHLGLVQLKGKEEPIRIHECINGDPENEFREKLSALPVFNEGMQYYLDKSFEKAHKAFNSVLENAPGDPIAKLFHSKTKQFIDKGIPENWIGVVEMHEK